MSYRIMFFVQKKRKMSVQVAQGNTFYTWQKIWDVNVDISLKSEMETVKK